MEAQLQFEKREMEAEKRQMEMRMKLADLAAREAFLEMGETESILKKNVSLNQLLFLITLLLRVPHKLLLQKNPPVSKKRMVVNTSNWES